MDFVNTTEYLSPSPPQSGWKTKFCDKLKRFYYVNVHTNKMQWNRPTSSAPREYPKKIRCSRILIKHHQSDYYPWRIVRRTKVDAAREMRKCYMLIKTKQLTFEQAVYQYSECLSGNRGGDIGWSNVQDVDPFLLLAFNLNVRDYTMPMETPEGYVIYMRTG